MKPPTPQLPALTAKCETHWRRQSSLPTKQRSRKENFEFHHWKDEKTEEEWQPSMKGKWMAANQRREPEQSQDGMAPRKDSCHGQSSQSTSASKKTTAAGTQTEKGSQNPKNDPKFELLTD